MLGIVILNYENWNETVECINSIYKYKPSLDTLKIYVIDNGSKNKPNNDFLVLLENNDDLMLIETKENLGFSKGNNIGISKAYEEGCDYVIVSNSDIYYRENSLDEIIKFYNNYSGICYPKIFDLEGNVPFIPYSFDTSLIQIYLRHTFLKKIFKKKYIELCENSIDTNSNEVLENYLNAGSCFALDRKSLEILKKLDEHTFLYYEEMILSNRASKNGIHIYFCPNSKVIHAIGQSTGNGNPFTKGCMYQSAIYYARYYLNCSKLQIMPLYYYACILYLFKAITDKKYRTGFKKFKKTISKYI